MAYAAEELAIVEIKALVASIYEPKTRVWRNGRWYCPHCHAPNERHEMVCACGITRDGLPEFRTKLDPGEAPARLQAVLILAIPAALSWFGLVTGVVKLSVLVNG